MDLIHRDSADQRQIDDLGGAGIDEILRIGRHGVNRAADLAEVGIVIRARSQVHRQALCELLGEIPGVEVRRQEALALIERILHQHESLVLRELRRAEPGAQPGNLGLRPRGHLDEQSRERQLGGREEHHDVALEVRSAHLLPRKGGGGDHPRIGIVIDVQHAIVGQMRKVLLIGFRSLQIHGR